LGLVINTWAAVLFAAGNFRWAGVVVLDVKKDERITYNLVTSEETDFGKGRISTNSPIGRALVGKEAGDTVKVQIPGGMREFEILELKTIHDMTEEV